jgi:hypothetical protein
LSHTNYSHGGFTGCYVRQRVNCEAIYIPTSY